jgi:adenylate cyclase
VQRIENRIADACGSGLNEGFESIMLVFSLANERQKQQFHHAAGPIEFGRLPKDETRIVVDDPYASRDQLRVEELDNDVRIENLGNSPLTLADGSQLHRGDARRVTPPLRIVFGRTTLDIGLLPSEDRLASNLQTINRPLADESQRLKITPPPQGRVPSAETLTQWFETLLTVQRSAAGSSAFYAETARAVVDLVGLDRGLVLLRRKDNWEPVASHSSTSGDPGQFSVRVLNQVQRERRTYFQSFEDANLGKSLVGVEAVVASPIFDEREAVVGVVYGSRDLRAINATTRGIEPLEAQFVQLLAGAVSAGLTRVSREAEAARARVQFEQFFSAELARALERDPEILAAKERELTLLFTDLRGFSKISQRIGTSGTYQLLADILDRLTNQIMDHGGVVIDYYGDGLAAMWNAPTEQPQHADRAVQAALAMLGELPAINSQWAEKLGGLVRLGIGLNTGRAQVGNSGSRRRFKYGPRGHAVNLSSRVEAATKALDVTCLLTESTRNALTIDVPLRRVCCARLTGMNEPVNLYELPATCDHLRWPPRREQYELALSFYEQNRAAECLATCRQLVQDLGGGDGPTNWLLQQAEKRLAVGAAPFDPVFAVETK